MFGRMAHTLGETRPLSHLYSQEMSDIPAHILLKGAYKPGDNGTNAHIPS